MWPLIAARVLILVAMIPILWTGRLGVPWVPTPLRKVRKMLDMARVRPGDLLYDLGCGDGRMIITAARHYGARAVGIEIDPLRHLLCQVLITILGLRGRVRIIHGDFFKQDLSDADVVTGYLLPDINEKLEAKLRRELRPTTRVVSSDYTFPGLHLLQEDTPAKIYLYDLQT